MLSVFSPPDTNTVIVEESEKKAEKDIKVDIRCSEKKNDLNHTESVLRNFESDREKLIEMYYSQSRLFSLPPLFTQWKQHVQTMIGRVRKHV